MKITYFSQHHDYNLAVDYGKMMGSGWTRRLKDFLHSEDMREAMFSVYNMYKKAEIVIYPRKNEIFSIMNQLDVTEINVAIINCNPLFTERSTGIAFANKKSSIGDYDLQLVNLFHKVNTYQRISPNDYTLEHWIEQYVFLFNTSLTGFASSHQRGLWFGFSRAVLEAISRNRQGVVFLFIGSEVQCRPYMNIVNHAKHTILRHDTLSYDALNDINLEIDGINGRNFRIKW